MTGTSRRALRERNEAAGDRRQDEGYFVPPSGYELRSPLTTSGLRTSSATPAGPLDAEEGRYLGSITASTTRCSRSSQHFSISPHRRRRVSLKRASSISARPS